MPHKCFQFPATGFRSFRGQVAIERTSSSAGNLRGQVATEFMLYIGVFIFMVIAAFIVINDLQASEIPRAQNDLAKETGEGFVTALTLSTKAGTGFSYNYTFPKTIFARPYSIDLRGLSQPDPFIFIDYAGDYGNFTYQYGLPKYNYLLSGACLGSGIVESDQCSNTLMFKNDGENLTIMQLP